MNGLNWRLTPENPDRSNIIIVTGFNPSWWMKEYGITFGREFHLDAQVHRDTLIRMNFSLQERFGDLPNFFGGEDYKNSYPMERRYGDALIPALFGCEVSFNDASGHPFAAPLNLEDEEVLNLTVPDLTNHPIIRNLFSECDYSKKPMVGELGFEGVINIAYKLRGMQLFMDMIDQPDLAHHLFEVVWKTIDTLVNLVRKRQDSSCSRPTYFVNCNCMVNMISGEMYKKHLLEYDFRFNKSFDIFGVHICNWTIDPYLESLSKLSGLAYLDMGADSNIEKVHTLFPDLCPAVFFHPEKFRNFSVQQIKREIAELGKRIGRGYILLSDLEVGTTDDQIKAAYEEAAKL